MVRVSLVLTVQGNKYTILKLEMKCTYVLNTRDVTHKLQ
jgi:hypothetical protein